MSPERIRMRDEILEDLLDVPPSKVGALLQERYGGDPELKQEIERLWNVRRRMASGFMRSGAPAWLLPRLDPGQQIGRYKIESLIGKGGMSVVYRAHDPVIGRFVAIKVLSSAFDADDGSDQRFLREVRTLGSIRHPNVVQVFDFGELEGLLYIVMECLEGEDLAKIISSGQSGDLEWKRTVAIQLAAALDHVHKAGIVHRDIKPANVFIERSGQAKLMDFGISRREEPGVQHATGLVGTPEYLSPEQVKGEHATKSSDIYSYGVLLFELFAGVKPFVGNTAELLYKIVHEDLPRKALRPLPESLTHLICRLTDKEPDSRPQSFLDIRDDLERLTPDSPFALHRDPRRAVTPAAILVFAVFILVITGLLFRNHQRSIVSPREQSQSVIANTALAPSAPKESTPAAESRSAKNTAKPSEQTDNLGHSPALSSAAPGPSQQPIPLSSTPELTTLPNAVANRPLILPFNRPAEGGPNTPGSHASSQPSPAPPPSTAAAREAPVGDIEINPTDLPTLASKDNSGLTRNQEPVHVQLRVGDILKARQAASANVLSVLRQYAAAFSARNLNAVESFRILTSEQRQGIAGTFAYSSKVEMTVVPTGEPEFDPPLSDVAMAGETEPSKASIEAQVTIHVVANNGEESTHRPRVRVGFIRNGANWKISSWD